MTTLHPPISLLEPFRNALGNYQLYRHLTPEHQEAKRQIEEHTSFLDDRYTFRDRVECILKGITEAPVCWCGEPLHYRQHRHEFAQYCSVGCMNKAPEIRQARVDSRTGTSVIHTWEPGDVATLCRDIGVARAAKEIGTSQEIVHRYMEDHGIADYHPPREQSSHERALHRVFPEAEANVRGIIGKKLEFDLWFPEEKVAVEIHGIYWHSEVAGGKTPSHHEKKRRLCEEQGIHLLQFWHTQVDDQFDIVVSIIQNALGRSEKIGARKCTLGIPTRIEEKEFFTRNHLQGFCPSSSVFGLMYDGEWVAMVSFRPSRFKKGEWELLRFCNRLGTQVQGGLSRILRYAAYPSIITYTNKMWARGRGYEAAGFTLVGKSRPSYWYTPGNRYNILYNRTKFQKHRLPGLLDSFDPSLSEWENMKANGWDRVWDCGTLKYEYTLK